MDVSVTGSDFSSLDALITLLHKLVVKEFACKRLPQHCNIGKQIKALLQTSWSYNHCLQPWYRACLCRRADTICFKWHCGPSFIAFICKIFRVLGRVSNKLSKTWTHCFCGRQHKITKWCCYRRTGNAADPPLVRQKNWEKASYHGCGRRKYNSVYLRLWSALEEEWEERGHCCLTLPAEHGRGYGWGGRLLTLAS